ncbi:MAG: methyl-accepting chemotaxis protein [Desulfuromonadaceae bacterium]|nr:methyl-accepting chemotaxis protein [Desulfuromonas sp.]MDY0184437.1 methyl-accepting chemotaxis protein [Desulfuromonadaceae bacterium]
MFSTDDKNETHPAYRRKSLNLGVKTEFQRWLMWRIFGVVLLSALVAALVLYFYARHETITTFYDAHIKLRRVSDLLLPVVLSGVGVSLLGGLLLALFLPQKIAGPLYNIERTLERVRSGSLKPRVKLRQHDCLEEMANEVNLTLDFMHERIVAAAELLDEIHAALDISDDARVREMLQRQQELLRSLLDPPL